MKIFDKLFKRKWNPDKHVLVDIPYSGISNKHMKSYMIYLQNKLPGWFTFDVIHIDGITRYRIMAHDISTEMIFYFNDRSPMRVVEEILNLNIDKYYVNMTKMNDGFTLYTEYVPNSNVDKQLSVFIAEQIQSNNRLYK